VKPEVCEIDQLKLTLITHLDPLTWYNRSHRFEVPVVPLSAIAGKCTTVINFIVLLMCLMYWCSLGVTTNEASLLAFLHSLQTCTLLLQLMRELCGIWVHVWFREIKFISICYLFDARSATNFSYNYMNVIRNMSRCRCTAAPVVGCLAPLSMALIRSFSSKIVEPSSLGMYSELRALPHS